MSKKPILPIAAVVVAAGALLLFESHLLWKVQELNLFLFTTLFFEQQMIVPAGLLTWLGTFFTQFLYRPWLGVLLLCGWWLLLMWLTKKAFRIPAAWSALLLVPVALLLIADVDMGYWIYVQKMRGWFFAPTIGTTVFVALVWAGRCMPAKYGLRLLFPVVTAVVGYPLFGIYALAAILVVVLVTALAKEKPSHTLTVEAVIALLCVVAVPLLDYRFLFHHTNIDNIWWAGLPVFRIFESYPQYYLPYILLAVFFIAVPVIFRFVSPQFQTRNFKYQIPTLVIVALLTAGVVVFWFKDENYHHELAMQHYVEQVKWGDVLEEAAKQEDSPTRAVVMMRNLALTRLGRQGDEMYHYRGGSRRPESPFPIQASQIVGSMMYYNYGMMNDCHHLCIEGGVEYGWRTEHLKYMARSAMMSGEVKVMRKFTGLLKHTMYYDRWAELLEDLQRNPKRMAEAAETGPILHMLHYPDMVGADNGYTEKYLMQLLAKLDSDDPYFQEQCLLATLWTKNADQFWPRFVKYAELHPHQRIPRHYQEAAYLFANLGRPDALKLPYHPDVKESYRRFMEQLRQFEGRDVEEVREILYPGFGDTFYFDYYLLSNLTYL